MIAFLRAGDRLEAGRSPPAPFFAEDTDLQIELVYRSAQFVFEHGNLLDAYPRIRTFTDKDCGYLILSAVMASAFDVETEPSLSCRRLARHFGISRSHVGNLIAMAASSGWFATDGQGRLSYISLSFVDEYRRWAASELAHYATIAEAVLASNYAAYQA